MNPQTTEGYTPRNLMPLVPTTVNYRATAQVGNGRKPEVRTRPAPPVDSRVDPLGTAERDRRDSLAFLHTLVMG